MNLCIQPMIPQRGGLPHSDTPGSKPARGSPGIFAACHVLHRLLAPRHPPDALLILKSSRHPSQDNGRPPCTGTIHATSAPEQAHAMLTHAMHPPKAADATHPSQHGRPSPTSTQHTHKTPLNAATNPAPAHAAAYATPCTGSDTHAGTATGTPRPHPQANTCQNMRQPEAARAALRAQRRTRT